MSEYVNESRQALRQGFKWLYTSNLFQDTSLYVGSEFENAHEIRVSGIILAAASDVFRAMLSGNYTESRDHRVLIPNYQLQAVEKMIKFIYTSEIEISDDEVVSLFTLADQYGIDELKRLCELHVGSAISKESVIQLLISAHEHNADGLKSKCMEFIEDNIATVLKSKHFVELSEELLIEVLKLEFRLDEEQVFYAVLDWGRHQLEKEDDDEKIELHTVLEKPIKYVRLSSLLNEFIRCVVMPLNILPQEVIMDVLFNRIDDPLEESKLSHEVIDYEEKPWLRSRLGLYKSLPDFGSIEEYETYMKRTLRTGMILKAVNSYESVQAGDEGEFIQWNGGVPPCQVRWTTLGNTYWLHWRDLQILRDH